MRFHTLIFAFWLFLSVLGASWSGCPPSGPLLPRPTNLHNSSVLRHGVSNLEETLHSVLNGSANSGFSVANTSFSLGLVSFDSPKPLWSFHHRGSANTNGTQIIDNDTQYLVGSISKLITDLLVLRTGIDLDTPITEYLPSLANGTSRIRWEEITLAGLTDHLAGIPPNYGFSDFYYLQPYLEELGFPEIGIGDYPSCGVTSMNGACSEEELLQGLSTIHPVTSPNTRPSYSTLAFTLLASALSAAYNESYASLLNTHIIQPFNLTNTGISPGTSSLATIPPVRNSWGADYSLSAPGGALGNKAEVDAWLKPHPSISSPYTLVGQPWEIYHLRDLTTQSVQIYGKNGGAYGYTAQFSLVDSLGMGIVVLTAGPEDAWGKVYDAMLGTFVPAMWEEAVEHAEKNGYTGRFTSADGLVKMGMKVAEDGVGVEVEYLTRNGSDMLDGIARMSALALPQFGGLKRAFRMFPANVEDIAETVKGTMVRQDWRFNMDYEPNTRETSGSDLPGQGARADECKAWQTADWLYYGGEAVDRIVIVRDEATGHVIGIEIPFLRAILYRGTS